MKVIYSLKEFHDEAVRISGEEPDLVRVQVCYGLYNKIEFSCYTNGAAKIFTGKTMEESLEELRKHFNPVIETSANIDVEIEMPEEKEVEDAQEK